MHRMQHGICCIHLQNACIEKYNGAPNNSIVEEQLTMPLSSGKSDLQMDAVPFLRPSLIFNLSHQHYPQHISTPRYLPNSHNLL